MTCWRTFLTCVELYVTGTRFFNTLLLQKPSNYFNNDYGQLRFSPKAIDHSHASAKQRRSHLNSRLGKVNFDGHFLSGENVRVSCLLEQRFEYVELWSTERCSLSPLLSRASCSFSNTCLLRKSDDLLYFTYIFSNYFKMLTILAEDTTNSNSS